MKSKKLKSMLSSVLVMTSLINPIVTYAGGGDEPEKQPSATASTKQLEHIYLMDVARYLDARSKIKLKKVNKKCKDAVEDMPADLPVEYLRTATYRIYGTPALDIYKPNEANFFRSSSKFWGAKHNLTEYKVDHYKKALKKFARNNMHFKDIVNKILEMDIFDTRYYPAISKPKELIKLLVNEFETKNPDYFEEHKTTKDNILNHILQYYLIDECFYCPIGEKLTDAEETDEIAMPVLKYIELFFSDFNIFQYYSGKRDKFFDSEPSLALLMAYEYGDKRYEEILTKQEIAKRVLSNNLTTTFIEYMDSVILYEQEDLPEELKSLVSFFIDTTKALMNAVFVAKDKNAFDIIIKTLHENIYYSDWMVKQLEILKNTSNEYRYIILAEIYISNLKELLIIMKDLHFDKLVEYLNS